ncbi:efflux transporter periplasmic adaptor subunit [Chitinophaga caeni]|uniref:Efflux transporter periplasmic adaptor subunit n=1 Tax=Chitinophaga caeni TaxID=2029983 RepID=A0A291QU62_9BACT|nr:efflux RND transporter periplasmic adaptor subunit [Chitinophaga caeni]ATL47508.1 efflux transporter periplasmic adaptor subunit [Chitinophaga caeni]
MRTKIITRISLLLGFVVAISACSSQKQDPVEAPEKWVLSESLLKQLKIDTATNSPVECEIDLTGKITANEDQAARIFPFISGIVTSVKVHSGDFVQRGEVLATIKSGEMAGYSADIAIAKGNVSAAQKQYDIAQSFLKNGLGTEQEVTKAKTELETAAAELERAKSVIAVNGGSSEDNYVIKSPVPGFVIQKSATENLHWRSDNADPIFVIADLKNVWAMLNVYESDIANIKAGDQVEISTLSYPGKIFYGKIEKLYNILDPESKVMKARVVIDNPGYLLKPEMFVSVKAKRHINDEMLSIPSRGIIFDHDKYYVLVLADNPAKVAVREIQVAKTLENRAYISSGLQNGDKVIASKQVFIYESLQQ